ncbi:NADH-quinone oxidoreductase subunit NuoE [Halarsenatibacter silvermanii]|uniref:NADP-reducing hydrogenase subunit HndA n=1 Tax=Halarsenatibacter silvermanii TaxID=321763 RepID=A0A1G9QLD2_9FIRM|nr:NADH-quinone oxidoreductase subunit NuoE [Halarsenatibacter silvermanii]SDM11819.1 NADP-reducing hydrogenase subunit HndA [Halarsenatibacter silvermanii]
MDCQCGEQREDLQKFLQPLEEILTEYEKSSENEQLFENEQKEKHLIPILQEAQEEYDYLPQDALRRIAGHLDLSMSEIYGVVTFYTQFHLQPRGEHIIQICTGTACHVRGAEEIVREMEKELGISSGETTDDLKFTLSTVACIGACGLAPVIMINEETYGRLTPDEVPEILNQYKS